MEFIGGLANASAPLLTPQDEVATMLMLVAEARRHDLSRIYHETAEDSSERHSQHLEATQRWRAIRHEVHSSLVSGCESTKVVRALFACKYPFLGGMSPEDINEAKLHRESVVERENMRMYSLREETENDNDTASSCSTASRHTEPQEDLHIFDNSLLEDLEEMEDRDCPATLLFVSPDSSSGTDSDDQLASAFPLPMFAYSDTGSFSDTQGEPLLSDFSLNRFGSEGEDEEDGCGDLNQLLGQFSGLSTASGASCDSYLSTSGENASSLSSCEREHRERDSGLGLAELSSWSPIFGGPSLPEEGVLLKGVREEGAGGGGGGGDAAGGLSAPFLSFPDPFSSVEEEPSSQTLCVSPETSLFAFPLRG